MKYFIAFAFHWGRVVLLVAVSFALALLLGSFLMPLGAGVAESMRGDVVSYEMSMRMGILFSTFLLLCGFLVWLFLRGARQHWIVFLILACAWLIGSGVLLFDTQNRLMDEYSWIRYATCFFLVLASGTSALLSRRAVRSRFFGAAVLWGLVSFGFLFGAADEVFQIHEAIGRSFEKTFKLPHLVTDLVTVAYALVALAVIIGALRVFFLRYREALFSLGLLIVGGIIYLSSTLFDTLDVYGIQALKKIARVLSESPSHVFGDHWFFAWMPKTLFNSLEEVLEYTSSALFFAAVFVLLAWKPRMQERAPLSIKRFRYAALTGALLFGLLLDALILGTREISARSPLVDTRLSIERLAGPADGLRHTDDLFYHKNWGLLVANEGRGTILQWKNDKLTVIPDPKKLLRDMDSVTATQDAVYVSDGNQATVFEYTTALGWKAAFTKEDGLVHPEAVVSAGKNVLYVLDESQKAVIRLEKGKPMRQWIPVHPEWKTPEGIAYSSHDDTLYVTDDTTGALFKVQFEKSIDRIAKLGSAEDIFLTKEGDLLITDNGRGSIVRVQKDGLKKEIARFKSPYRDVQGVARDEERVYVVTADGFDSQSFMPSFLFAIPAK